MTTSSNTTELIDDNEQGSEMTLSPKLLELLVCPVTKGPLEWHRDTCELVSKSARLAYRVKDGIPIMLPDEARALEEGEY